MGPLQAVKLKETFIELYKNGSLTMEKLKAASLAWNDVFEELPIRIQNSNLAMALLAHIEPTPGSQQSDFQELALGTGPMLLKTLDFMNEFLDDVVAEQQKVRLSLPKDNSRTGSMTSPSYDAGQGNL